MKVSRKINEWSLDVRGHSVRFDPIDGNQRSYSDTITHFAERILTGLPFETPPQQALTILEAVEEIYRSSGAVAE